MNMSIWFLVGAILVFFMQCGFAMVETGFTRAKNAGNIIMKNLMDFCIGTVVFILFGYGLMMGDHGRLGMIGRPEWGMFLNFEGFDWSSFVFQLVFCATAATIVSGAMAERTKFSAYCLYSALISLAVYPVEAGWVWGGGWLSRLHFIDFAGSCVIHIGGCSHSRPQNRKVQHKSGRDGSIQCHPRSLPDARCAGLLYSMVRMVRV